MVNLRNNCWSLYKKTIFVMVSPLGKHLSYAIVTAENPAGVMVPDSVNLMLDNAIQARIIQMSCQYRCLYGCSPDYSHYEKSWALVIEKHKAIQLAKEFEQNAIYWVEKGELYLTPVCMEGVREESLGDFGSRCVATSWPVRQ